MKKVILSCFIMLFAAFTAFSCEIEFEIQGTKKATYKAGDEIIVKVRVTLTHRTCVVALNNTKFDTKGLEILGGTDWKEVTPGVWERKLKMKAAKTQNGKLILQVTRTCDKEGGSGTLTLVGENE
jgi:hypothetical protein